MQQQPVVPQTVKEVKAFYEQQVSMLKAQEQACLAYVEHLRQYDENMPMP